MLDSSTSLLTMADGRWQAFGVSLTHSTTWRFILHTPGLGKSTSPGVFFYEKWSIFHHEASWREANGAPARGRRLAVATTTQNCGASEAAASRTHRIGAGGTWKLPWPRENLSGTPQRVSGASILSRPRAPLCYAARVPAPLLLYRATPCGVWHVCGTNTRGECYVGVTGSRASYRSL